jgi:hypothetical protein
VLGEGPTIDVLAFLVRATASADDATILAVRQAHADSAHPAVLDARLRALCQALLPKLRFNDTAVDANVHDDVQPVPNVSGSPAALGTS